MSRLVLQMGRNGASLGIALAMAKGLGKIGSVLLIGDKSCMESQDLRRVQAWMDNDWSSLYELSSVEEKAFLLPVCEKKLSLEFLEVPGLSEFDHQMQLPLESTDIIDVRTGTKPMSILLTRQGLIAGATIVYSDVRRGGFLNLQSGKMHLSDAPRLSLMEHLCLAHNGPVIATDVPTISTVWNSPGLIDIANEMRNKNNISKSRNKFEEKLYELMGIEPPIRFPSFHPSMKKVINEYKTGIFATAIETLTAAICSNVLDGEWGMNVRFLDSTANVQDGEFGRIPRYLLSAKSNLYKQDQLENLKAGNQTQGFPQWKKENPEPQYDPLRLVNDDFSGAFMHEIDVIGRDSDKMYLVSVKNRWTPTEEKEIEVGLYKELDNLLLRHRHHLNAHNCECILVTGMPISDRLMDAARELGVHACFVLDFPELLTKLQLSE